MRKTLLAAAAAGIVTLSTGASAAIISYTLNANGVTDTFAQQGTAVFTFDTSNLNSFKVTLTDNVSPTADILSELDGLTFNFSSAPTDLMLQSITAASIVDCTNSANPCPAGTGSFPYGWGATLNGSQVTFGAGFDSGTNSFAHEPFGIVNANYTAPGGTSGLSSAANNPLFIGPVTFTFAATGLDFVPEVMGVSFDFGTRPTSIAGVAAAPEPQSLALLGFGLFAVWFVRRRRS